MTAQEKYEIAMKFLNEGQNEVYRAIMDNLTDDELLSLLEA